LGMFGGPPGAALGFVGGGILGAWASRLFFEVEPEETNSLKLTGIGHCGEWSIAFRRVLICAGVRQAKMVYADNDPGAMPSPGHGGTDTAVVIKDDDGKNRIFDIYREMYNSLNENSPSQRSGFSNYPMTGGDVQPYDTLDSVRKWLTWQEAMGRKVIKDNQGNVLWQK